MAFFNSPGPFPRNYGRVSTVNSLASGDDAREIKGGISILKAKKANIEYRTGNFEL